MTWTVEYMDEALADLYKLDGSQKIQVSKAIKKVSSNPLPLSEGGYGKPLGNKYGNNLTGLLKIKLKKSGIRVVYDLIRDNDNMRIIVVGIRENEDAYIMAKERLTKRSNDLLKGTSGKHHFHH